ncbi:hypothetical protein [Candidatus Neptunichlamydia sp. REUL1]|uniref:hypothetical protein n=1 Tax=Candidatus Neptunichlamydia sp. REUL1 TaxID=3064277 RepID=UPI00292F531C|nr:hypothetical protein [Candidatus Neptunochlamydia sp. REUL1]
MTQEKVSENNTLTDKQQTAWQLSSIQLVVWSGLPLITTSFVISQKNSLLGALLTLFIGNLILGIIRFGVLSMSYKKRHSTLDLAGNYMGKCGRYIIAILLLASTLFWFTELMSIGTRSIIKLIFQNENVKSNQWIRISVLLGIISTLFCIGNMKLIRRLCTFTFPVLLIFLIICTYFIPVSEINMIQAQPYIPFSGFGFLIATGLGVTADFPTFFRHGASWKTAIRALIATQIICLGLGVIGIYIAPVFFELMHGHANDWTGTTLILKYALLGFTILSTMSSNVTNIYSASVGWELLAPESFLGKKELLILGLGLTTVFTTVGDFLPAKQFAEATDLALVNLACIFIFAYIVKLKRTNQVSSIDQLVYLTTWILATIINSLQFYNVCLTQFSYLSTSLLIITVVGGAGSLVRKYKKKR